MIGGNGQQGLPLAGRSKHACAAAPSISAEIAVAHPPRLPSGHGSPARLAEVAGHPAGRLAQPRRSRRWPDGYCKRERCEALVAAKPNPPPFDLGPGMPDVRSGHRTARRPLWAAVQGGLAMTSSDTLDGSNRRRRSQLFLQMLLFAQLVLAHAMHVRRSCVRFVLERVAPRRVYSPYLFPIPWQGPGVSPHVGPLLLSVTCFVSHLPVIKWRTWACSWLDRCAKGASWAGSIQRCNWQWRNWQGVHRKRHPPRGCP